jgi:hypothetical protein
LRVERRTRIRPEEDPRSPKGTAVSRRIRRGGDLVASGLGALAIYASVRAAIRAGWFREEEAGRLARPARASKRDRQHDHPKTGLEVRARSEAVANDVAAPMVKKDRARARESRSAASISDLSPSRRSGRGSPRGSNGRTYRQLYEEARLRGVRGRSAMSKAELEEALSRVKSGAAKAS